MLPDSGRVNRPAPSASRQHMQRQSTAYADDVAHLFVDDVELPYEHDEGAPYHWFRARRLGGRLLLWSGVCLRLGPDDLGEVDDDSGEASWPITYDELEPQYRAVETVMGVSGGDEKCSACPAPAATRSLPFSEGERRLARAARSWPHRQLLSPRIAHAGPEVLVVRALRTGRLTLHVGAVAVDLLVDGSGERVEGVVTVDPVTGHRSVHRARAVVLACSPIETIRLMLASRSTMHPDGVGNKHDQLGRYFLDHSTGPTVSGTVRVGDDDPDEERDLVPVTHVPDFTRAEGRSGLPGGFGFTAFVPRVRPANPASRRLYDLAPRGRRAFRIWSHGEVRARPERCVTLGSRRDRTGVPVPRVHFAWEPDDLRCGAAQARAMEELAKRAGFEIEELSTQLLAPGSSIHEMGGARMGTSPDTSVVDPTQRVWGVSNLYVGDAACFPRAGWQPPTLTVMALGRRAATHVSERLARGEL